MNKIGKIFWIITNKIVIIVERKSRTKGKIITNIKYLKNNVKNYKTNKLKK